MRRLETLAVIEELMGATFCSEEHLPLPSLATTSSWPPRDAQRWASHPFCGPSPLPGLLHGGAITRVWASALERVDRSGDSMRGVVVLARVHGQGWAPGL